MTRFVRRASYFLVFSLLFVVLPHLPGKSDGRSAAAAGLEGDLGLQHGEYAGWFNLQRQRPWQDQLLGPDDSYTVADCGCFMSVLSSVLRLYSGGLSLPWFVMRYVDTSTGKVTQDFSISPGYVDSYLRWGRDPNNPPASLPENWGYKVTADPADTCGSIPHPWALEEIMNPVIYTTDPETGQMLGAGPTGLAFRIHWNAAGRGLTAAAHDMIRRRLRDDQPTGIVLDNGDTRHAQLIVGWDAELQQYLVLDPLAMLPKVLYATYPAPLTEPSPTYAGWEQRILGIIEFERTFTGGSWLVLEDDPAPIEIMAISPDGKRTGYDPITGASYQEDPDAFSMDLGAWADPLGEVPAGETAKSLAVRDPTTGVYRFTVLVKRDGPINFRFVAVDGGQETTLLSVDQSFTQGQVLKYVVSYERHGESTVTQVDDFTPQAEIGNDRVVRAGASIELDGSRSVAFDGQLVSYAWAFGDGAVASGPRVAHSYAEPGRYQATLTVTDDRGQTGTDTVTVLVVEPAGPGAAGQIELASVSGSEEPQNGLSGSAGYPAISADGGTVAFESYSTNLVASDTNANKDIFVRELDAGTTERVSVTSNGDEVQSPYEMASGNPAISADGRFVAFASWARLAAEDTDSEPDVYIHDRQTGATELISTGAAGMGSFADWPAVSADGRFVAFFAGGMYLRDRVAGTTELVGAPRRDRFVRPSISADGRYVAYDRTPTSGFDEVVVWDRETKATELISVSTAGVRANHYGRYPSMSADGRYVAFQSLASNLVPGDTNGMADIYVRDRVASSTRRVSVSSEGIQGDLPSERPSISGDGQSIAFHSSARNLVSGDTNGRNDIFLHELATGLTSRINVAENGVEPAGGNSMEPAINADGSEVAFLSTATNLIDGANVGQAQNVYVWGRQAPQPIADPGGPYIGWATGPGSPAAIRFDGTRSFDRAGAALTAIWDFGDGSPPLATQGLTASHSYAEPGTYTATLVVNNGKRDSYAVTTAVDVLPALPEDALVVGPACSEPGGTVQISGFANTANALLRSEGWNLSRGPLVPQPVKLSTPWTGPLSLTPQLPDLSFQTALDIPPQTQPGSYEVRVTDGPISQVRVACPPPANHAPIPHAGGPYYTAGVGQPVRFDGSLSNDRDGDALSYTWYFGDDSTGTGSNPEHSYSVPGTYHVTLIVDDGKVSSFPSIGTRSFAKVTVAAPVADSVAPETTITMAPAPNQAGWNREAVSVRLSAMDNARGSGVKELIYSAAGAQPIPATAVAGALTEFVVDAEGATTITAFAVDQAGNREAPRTMAVKVDRSGPEITVANPEPYAVLPAGSALSFAVADSLSGVDTATASLGDGVSSSQVSSGTTIARPGIYTLTVSGSDLAGNSSSVERQFVVYDPSAGFVTGGGWITSPPGALAADPSASGPASFGFVSRYQKGATAPAGVTQFQFQAGDLAFHADQYEWLVVAGARAQFKGSGTINRQGGYGFMLTAIDGQLPGGDGSDRFRIKIWDKQTGQAVYDNQLGADEKEAPTTRLEGGSITIHAGK